MRLYEFDSSTVNVSLLHDEENDQSVINTNDTRKTKLTLKQLNTIRRAREVKRYELEEKQKLVQKQYSSAADTDSL